MSRLSRPAKGNALNDAMIAGIESFFGDPPEETRTIILHAEGKHFMAGDVTQSGRLNEVISR
jgi:enoyl-CoA hydratase/carnithine racemase